MRQVRNATKYLATVACLVGWTGATYAETDVRERAAADQRDKAALSKQLWDWYGQASELHDAGKLSEAWALYQRVWKHRKTYDVATSLGGVCFQRKEYAAAAHYYRIALEEMVPTQSPKFVAEVKEAFDAARAEVAELKVSVAPLNGKPVAVLTVIDQRSNLPLEQPYYLEPGELTLEARTPGQAPVTIEVIAKPGATLKWQLDFAAVNSGAVDPAPDHPANDGRTTTERHPWIVFPIGGVVTAGLAYGAFHNAGRGEEAYDAAAALGLRPGDCNGTGAADAASCERAAVLRNQSRDADTRAWLFGSGAVLSAAATGIVYWFWETEVPVAVAFDPLENQGEVRWTYDF